MIRQLFFPAILLAVVCLGCERTIIPPSPDEIAEDAIVDALDSAETKLLFVGNSHTHFHNIPKLVSRMIQSLDPDASVVSWSFSIDFLDQAHGDPTFQKLLASHPWTAVVLQAQKISSSGKYKYSTQEGIAIAKQAKAAGSTVFFFSEWGRRGIAGEGESTHQVYTEMAQASDAEVIPVGKAWDMALAQRPDLTIHAADGNHETEIGAFLTACVIAGKITGKDPSSLRSFEHGSVSLADREFLSQIASQALAEVAVGENK